MCLTLDLQENLLTPKSSHIFRLENILCIIKTCGFPYQAVPIAFDENAIKEWQKVHQTGIDKDLKTANIVIIVLQHTSINK